MVFTQTLQVLRIGSIVGLLLSAPLISFGLTNAIETPSPQPVRLPTPILPSHVYQQAGGLLSQLQVLPKQVQAHPTWLQ